MIMEKLNVLHQQQCIDLEGDLKWAAWDAASEQLNGKGTENFSNKELIQRTDDLSHPFFGAWNISIPKGIKARVEINNCCYNLEEGKYMFSHI